MEIYATKIIVVIFTIELRIYKRNKFTNAEENYKIEKKNYQSALITIEYLKCRADSNRCTVVTWWDPILLGNMITNIHNI